MTILTTIAFFLLCSLSSQGKADTSSIEQLLVPIEITNTTTGIDTIDCIYVINLKERKDRWDVFVKLLQQFQIGANRVEAINGWFLSKEDCEPFLAPYSLSLKGGQIGCILSHMSVWKNALEQNFQRIWVLEDDIEFTNLPKMLEPLLTEMDNIDPSWDILYTDPSEIFGVYPQHKHLLENPSMIGKQISMTKNITRVHGRWRAHSMIISASGLVKLFDYMTNMSIFGPLDYQIHFIPGLKEYSLNIPIGTPGPTSEGPSNTREAPRTL